MRIGPSLWFNSTVTSWANSGSRDLHLDLREIIKPGARGTRELLLGALRDAVRSGRLAPGSMLPPSRSLATDLGLARNTVAEAYAELVNEGWLASRQGAGTWVLNAGGAEAPPRARGVRAAPVHNLMPGSPDVSEFPRTEWAASARRALSTAPTEALRMGDQIGALAPGLQSRECGSADGHGRRPRGSPFSSRQTALEQFRPSRNQ